MMFQERFILRNWSHFRALRNSISHSGSTYCRYFRFLPSVTSIPEKKFVSFAVQSVRRYSENTDYLKAGVVGERGFVKQIIIRGKAATDVQEAILSEFITQHDEASVEQWKSLLNKLFELPHGMIHETNVDGRVLETCLLATKLPLARSYLIFLKSSGKKFNTVSVCGFLKICHECQSLMTPEDAERVKMFTKYLLTKHRIFDPITGDAVIKGLLLCDMLEEAFRILEDIEKITAVHSTTYAALASYLIRNNELDRAKEYLRLMLKKNLITHHKVFIDWVEFYQNDRQKLDELLAFFAEFDMKPSKEICDHLVAAYKKLPSPLALNGVYGHVQNSGECSVCGKPFNRLDLSEEEFNKMRSAFFESVVIGKDVFMNSTPEELQRFISFVEKNGPFDIILDGLNIAFMSGVSVSPDVFLGLTKGVVTHFHERGNKMLLIGRKHMKAWPNFISTLQEFDVKYFLIDDISEDDVYTIYSTLYSGLDAYFVTRDLLRHEKFALNEDYRRLFKRWQQSHQIFITYVAPSGKVYMKTPVLFQMMAQKTSSGGWHIPYWDSANTGSNSKEEYGIHRKWLCLDRESS